MKGTLTLATVVAATALSGFCAYAAYVNPKPVLPRSDGAFGFGWPCVVVPRCSLYAKPRTLRPAR